jgi:hypothetical protein
MQGAPREDDDKCQLVIMFFCFVYVHPKNMIMSASSLLSFLFCPYAPKEDDDELALIIIFIFFVYVHPEKTTTSVSSLLFFFILFLCT